jgi:hypothetical protein
MLMKLSLALGEQCATPREGFPRGKTASRTASAHARFADLQRRNGLIARMKKQHLPAKNPLFPLDTPFFSISIRSASASAVFTGGSTNF